MDRRKPILMVFSCTGNKIHSYKSINGYCKSSYIEHCKHGLCYIEGVSPVMICDGSVILLHATRPPTYHLQIDNKYKVIHTSFKSNSKM